jgi:hypothetical protein
MAAIVRKQKTLWTRPNSSLLKKVDMEKRNMAGANHDLSCCGESEKQEQVFLVSNLAETIAE